MEALKQGFFAIDVSNYLVLWNVNLVRVNVKRQESRKMALKSIIAMVCKKYQQQSYKYPACESGVINMIPKLVCESVSIRGIARILRIALATVTRKIKQIAVAVIKPPVPLNRKVFELDEVRTYIGKKENQYWIAYAICSETRQVIDFIVGKRSKRTLKMIVNTLLLSGVEIIKTDKLNIYQSLIPRHKHVSAAYNINHIERNNLNLRTHLKRLSRRTICFSKKFNNAGSLFENIFLEWMLFEIKMRNRETGQ